ncbi:PAS domain S-box protein [Microvirga arabica]|uniref:Blue-light-activated histidine kinase n=1 Tax=Microvirga arabica TaxID=1128671 RepID=A0ABV6YAC2_9HYPH
MRPDVTGPELYFLGGDGEAGALMRSLDWSASPLGNPKQWPQSLRTVVSLMLNSKFPMFVAWGPELGFLYNDGYAEILGAKHPAAMGGRFGDIWSEIWPDIEPLIGKALAGEASYREDLPLVVRRRSFDEQAYFTFSYSPVYDETGGIGGMFCAVTETTREVEARASLRAEKDRLQSFFQQAPGLMVMLIGPEHVFELANPSYLKVIGEREVIGKTVREALPELAGQDFFEILDGVYATGEPFVGRQMPITLQRPGEPPRSLYFDFVYQPITDSQGRVIGIFGEGHDVTDLKRAEIALRESEERFRTVADSAPALIWMSDETGQIIFANHHYETLFGNPANDLEGEGWTRVVHPEDLDSFRSAYLRAFERREPVSVNTRVRDRDGQIRWLRCEGVPRLGSDGRFLGFTGCNVDVSEAKQAEIALRDSEERFSTALTIADLGTFDWNLRDNTVVASERTRAIFGFAEGEGGRAEDYFSRMLPEDVERVRAEVEAMLRGSGRLDTQYRIHLPDGSIRYIASLSQLYRDAQGQPEREVGVFEDITEQKQWEEHQLLLINELNHRVKNTLATVQSIASQTLRTTETAAEAKTAIESRLLALSRTHDVLTRENWEGADLYEIVEQAVAPYSSESEDRLHLSGPKVRLSPRMALALAMALQELATNAVKYGALSNATGQITVTWNVEQGEPSTLDLRWAESGGPAVRTPTRRGFGSRLIERSLAQDLGGNVQIAFAPTGVTCTVRAPLT